MKDERVIHQAKLKHVAKQVKRVSTGINNSNLSKHLLTHPDKGDVLTRGVKTKENCCIWASQRKSQTINLIGISSAMLEHHITPEEHDILYQDSIKNEEGGVLIKGMRTTNDGYKWVSQQEKHNGKQSRKLHTMLEHHEMAEELVPLHLDSINNMRSVSDSCFSKEK